MPHRGHIEFLKLCKQIVSPTGRVIVGLTTDELAERQKRKTIMNYQQRRDILIEFPFVDAVVANTGQSKCEMFSQLHFTDVAIGDEYKGDPSYLAVQPHCQVHFIPCPLNRLFSSTAIASRMGLENAQKFRVLSNGGPGGLLFLYDELPEPIVLKTLRISQLEHMGAPGTAWTPQSTANVYNIPIPNPRNWKRLGDPHKYPNLPGVNSYRELAAQALIKGRSWSTVIGTQLTYENPESSPIMPPAPDWSHINTDKQSAKEIHWIYMRYAGPTLHDWINAHEQDADFMPTLQSIVDRVHEICDNDLRHMGLIHYDLHEGNICVQKRKSTEPQAVGAQADDHEHYNVFLIDFGWCLHRAFQMDNKEREHYETQLAAGFDWRHFTDSMEYSCHMRPWFKQLKL